MADRSGSHQRTGLADCTEVRLSGHLEPRFDGIEAGLSILDLTRFLDANRFPLRLKTLYPRRTLEPPSTGNVTPVMKLASSEARNNAALATSQPVPIFLRSGTLASRSASTSARLFLNSRARVSTAIGVFIRPGRMTLARMPYWAFW